MAAYEFFLTSTLEKVFPARRPRPLPQGAGISAWRGARAAVQLVYTARSHAPGMPVQRFSIEIAGAPVAASLRGVELIPSDFPCYENSDEHYITKEPGLFPDLLRALPEAFVTPLPRQYRSVWLSWEIPDDAAPGVYSITVTARACARETLPTGSDYENPDAPGQVYSNTFRLLIGRARLPAQTLIHTEWLHTDCLAEYYGVEPFSEAYWRTTDAFVRSACREHGVNMLLTPVFTPPLDTAVNAERTTIQLVDIRREGTSYGFGFDKLARWAAMCKRCGVEYLEMPHLFTQWGARATPKIIVEQGGMRARVFGWDVPADSPAYRAFLESFLPALRAALARLGYDDAHVYYHISDEPSRDSLAAYRTARGQVADLLDGCRVIDAISDFAFYQEGLVATPICASDQLQPFLDARPPELWTYYCCAQGDQVPNRFFAMESARNRIMGVLLYLYNLEGFLHWGYNFYHAKFSLCPLDPYRVTHGDYGFPSGDPFLVYPGPDGAPLSSIRAEVQDDALLDLRALRLLERLAGRSFVEALVYEDTSMRPMTFHNYPANADYLLALREKVAAEIEKRQ